MEALEVIVADTCVVIWLALAPEKLSTTATIAIEEARKTGGLAICGVTLHEIAWLVAHGRIQLRTDGEAFLSGIEANFIVLPITALIAHLAAALPDSFPGDPMDRMITAAALHRGVPLITSDKAIPRSKAVAVVW